jgi:hypothetical protein
MYKGRELDDDKTWKIIQEDDEDSDTEEDDF